MTRLQSTGNAPQVPATVAINSLAIAAGSAGHSLSICFRDYPAPMLCEMWKRQTSGFDAEQVCHVHTAKNVRDLATRIPEVRVVVVHTARLLIQVNWTLRFSRPETEETVPVVLTSFVPENLDEDPGATLILQGDPSEINRIGTWLRHVSERNVERGYEGFPPVRNMDQHLDSALRQQLALTCSGADQLRYYLVLRGLMAGACARRATMTDRQSAISVSIEFEDYDLARRLLQSKIVSSGQELCDPLAIAMVDRANVYLEVKHDPHATNGNPFYNESDEAEFSRRPPRELITRREIADLGNPRSRMVRCLIDHLHAQSDGYGAIYRMGYRRRPPTSEEWRTSGAEAIIPQLTTWSPKQVRTHFDRLQRVKLVSAERECANGPWRYVLPEELSTAISPFHGLPSAAELQSVEIATDGRAGNSR